MISIIVATYNGQSVLPKTLDAFCELDMPDEPVEFIVVNNASTDNTAAIINSYESRLPLRLMSEKQQGKGFALHTGIAAAKGGLIIFADDDVIPSKAWLKAFTEAAKTHTDFDVFMGQIRPFWSAPAPKWLKRLTDEGRSCGCTSIELKEGAVEVHLAKGANFAIRKSVLETVAFRKDLWVAGKSNVGGEDTDFIRSADKQGHKLWYCPDASLQHIIRKNEMKLAGVLKRYFRIGRTMAALYPNESDEKMVFGYPRWFIVQQVKKLASSLKELAKFNSYGFASKLIEISMAFGQQYQYKNEK